LRLFEGMGGTVEYQGQFSLDSQQPCYEADAPETDGGLLRSVIVFRLRPVDAVPILPAELSAAVSKVTVSSGPIEEIFTEKMVVEPVWHHDLLEEALHASANKPSESISKEAPRVPHIGPYPAGPWGDAPCSSTYAELVPTVVQMIGGLFRI
jgi:hypothetical protein